MQRSRLHRHTKMQWCLLNPRRGVMQSRPNFNGTWRKEDINSSREISKQKVIGTKWVCAIKRNEHGDTERFKAQLVALGYRQTYRVNYHETHSQVANMNSTCILLAVCCHNGMTIHQYDVDTAFINGVLKENVYICTVQGVDIQPNQVFKLNRAACTD